MKDVKKKLIPMRLRRDESESMGYFGQIVHDQYGILENNIKSFLHYNEISYFASLKFEKRKKDFLTGCFITKTVVAAYLNEENFKEFEIARGIFKQPLVRFRGWDIPGVSLSHSKDWSVAISFPLGHNMGVDIEKIDSKRVKVIKSQMSTNEVDFIENVKGETSSAFFQFWTIKEALSKALTCGLMSSFSIMEIIDPQYNEKGEIFCRFKNFSQYKCHSWQIEDFAVSVVLPKNTELILPENFSIKVLGKK